MTDVETISEVKAKNSIVDLVAESFSVTGQGRIRRTKEHDSLTLWPESNSWWWYSRDVGGDVLDWVMYMDGVDFRTALEMLAARAGVSLAPLSPEATAARSWEQERRRVFRTAADWFHAVLLGAPAAVTYCESRGWTMETIQRERIGYMPGVDERPEGILPLHQVMEAAGLLGHPAAKAVLSIPARSLVYVHRRHGQIVYLSGRSIETKRHFNLPERIEETPKSGIWLEAAGPRQVYENSIPARAQGRNEEKAQWGQSVRVLVEGQGDAISLGQLGIEAVALCGVDGGWRAAGGEISHVALDSDEAGWKKAITLAMEVSPTCRVVAWTNGSTDTADVVPVKDGNDYLRAVQHDPPVHILTLEQIFEAAPLALVARARDANNEKKLEKKTEIQREILDAFASLDEMIATEIKEDVAEALGVGIQQFNRMAKTRQKEREVAEGKTTPDRYETSAGGCIGGVLFEQCVQWLPDGRGKTFYAVRWPNGEIERKPMVDVAGTAYVPYSPQTSMLRKGVVLFPEEPAPYGGQRQLLRDVQDFIHRYLDVDPFYERLASYYVLFTWLYDLFETLPYLRALGDYGTGKSRFIYTIGSICYRPMMVAGATTVSPIFRLIDMFQGTLVLDESDFSNSDAQSEIIKIINLGYDKRQGFAIRSEKDPESDTYMPDAKVVFGPKILATRYEFNDKATESRCLTKRMSTARPRPGIPFTLGREFWGEAQKLRNKLLQYRMEKHRPIDIDPNLADRTIEPRLNQVIMALKSIIEDPAMVEELGAFMASYNQQLIGKRQLTLPALVLGAVIEIYFGTGNIYGERDLTMKGIAEKAQEYVNEWDPDERISARRVTDVLSELGLNERETINGRGSAFRGRSMLRTTADELRNLAQRYGIELPTQDDPQETEVKS